MKYLILCALVATAAAWPFSGTTEGPGANEGPNPFGNFPGPNEFFDFLNGLRPPMFNIFNRKPTTEAAITTEGPAARQFSPYDPYYGQQHPYSDPNAPVFPAQFQMFQYFGRQNRTETTTPYWQNPNYYPTT